MRTVNWYWPDKLGTLLSALLCLWDKRIKTQDCHASQEFLFIGGTGYLLACSGNSDQAVARTKIEQRDGGTFQVQCNLGCSSCCAAWGGFDAPLGADWDLLAHAKNGLPPRSEGRGGVWRLLLPLPPAHTTGHDGP